MIASTSSLLATALLFPVNSSQCSTTTFMKSKTHQSKTCAALSVYTLKSIDSNNRIRRLVRACSKNDAVTDHDHDHDHAPDEHNYQVKEVLTKIKNTMATYLREDDDHVQELVLIDAIQRLGLDHYFRDDIRAALEKYYVLFNTMDEGGDDLHDIALRFRLLRQQGFHVSTDTFNKFKDKEGKFKLELKQDTKGLLSLFEASHLSIPNEDILDEAGDFSLKLLKTTLNTVESIEAAIIRNTLSNPSQKSLPRLTGVTKMNQLQNFESSIQLLHDCFASQRWIEDVKNLARIDINLSQIALQLELTHVSRWSSAFHTAEVNLVRDRPEKWHMWSSNILPGLNNGELRIELTKSIAFIYIIDDIFDVYGKPEELNLFVEAVNRWEYENINGLPDYMKTCLKALYDTTREMNEKVYIKHGWYAEDCLRKAWAELCNAFTVEARWFSSKQLPTTEEYMKKGVITTGIYIVFATLFSLLGEKVNSKKHTQHDCDNHPDIVTEAGTLLRLSDDVEFDKDMNQDEHDGSFVACYMNEHQGSSDQIAQECVFRMISNASKRLNEEYILDSRFSQDFKIAFLNLARMIPIMYKYDHTLHLPILEKHMKILLCDN